MEINERISVLREHLGLSMKEFGAKISLSQPSVSLIESGKATLTERTLRSICAAWNVNEEWLRTGMGKMFTGGASVDVAAIVKKYSFPEICAKLLYAYDSLPPDQQEAVLSYAHSFIISVAQDEPAIVMPVINAPSEEEAARQAIARRMKEGTSPSSIAGSTETA